MYKFFKFKIFTVLILILLICSVSHTATYRINSNGSIRDESGQIMKPSSTVIKNQITPVSSNYSKNNINAGCDSSIKYIDIVVDYSGSMRSTIDRLKNSVNSIVSSMPKDTYIGLRKVGGDYSCKATEQLAPLALNNGFEISTAMESKSRGNEPLVLGTSEAIASDFPTSAAGEVKKIILITDGGYTCRLNPCTFVEELVSKRNDIRIDIIYTSTYYRDTLSCMAKMTGGNIYVLKNGETGVSSALNKSMCSIPDDSYTKQTSNGTSKYNKTKNEQNKNEAQTQYYEFDND